MDCARIFDSISPGHFAPHGIRRGAANRIKGTNTIHFIRRDEVPSDRFKDVTYGQFVCTVRPEKDEQNRTRLVVGGDRVNYPGEVATSHSDFIDPSCPRLAAMMECFTALSMLPFAASTHARLCLALG